MITFWFIAAGLIAIGLAFVLPPLLDNRQSESPATSELNRALYRQRLAELERDRENGSLDDRQYGQACHELQREFLADMEGNKSSENAYTQQSVRASNRMLAGFILLGLPLLAAGLYWQFDSSWREQGGSMDTVLNRDAVKQPRAEEVIARLETRLAGNPQDVPGWTLLGHAYMALERYARASAAYQRANEMTGGNNPELLVAYAEAIGLANGGRFETESVRLLEKALSLKPEHSQALWLAGWAAYQQQDYAVALKHWEKLSNVAPPQNPEQREALSKFIESAEQRLERENI